MNIMPESKAKVLVLEKSFDWFLVSELGKTDLVYGMLVLWSVLWHLVQWDKDGNIPLSWKWPG